MTITGAQNLRDTSETSDGEPLTPEEWREAVLSTVGEVVYDE